jgi:hypothetical protein
MENLYSGLSKISENGNRRGMKNQYIVLFPYILGNIQD